MGAEAFLNWIHIWRVWRKKHELATYEILSIGSYVSMTNQTLSFYKFTKGGALVDGTVV